MKYNDNSTIGWLLLIGAGSYIAYLALRPRALTAGSNPVFIDLRNRQPRPLPSWEIPAERRRVLEILQRQLRTLGYRIPTISGIPDPDTSAAIQRFATQHHISLTGGAAAETRIILAVDDAYGVYIETHPQPQDAVVATS